MCCYSVHPDQKAIFQIQVDKNNKESNQTSNNDILLSLVDQDNFSPTNNEGSIGASSRRKFEKTPKVSEAKASMDTSI